MFANVLRHAVELEELPASPLDRLSWRPPKVSETVDRRVVVNPRQARELLIAVTYVGERGAGLRARGRRLMALYACMYFAALRPAEAVALRLHDCYLPDSGWGRITLQASRPEVNRRWTDTASAHGERGLKHRPKQDSRAVPIPPEQVVSPLAGRPYDLRHAAVSLWLNAGVPAIDVAERAGHSVEVLLRVYAKCLDEGTAIANRRIEAALREAT